jgi:hypothetical protein
LRAIRRAEATELVEPVLEFLWDDWEEGEGAYGDDDDDGDDDNNVPLFSSREHILSYFPDEQRLDIETFDETPRFINTSSSASRIASTTTSSANCNSDPPEFLENSVAPIPAIAMSSR